MKTLLNQLPAQEFLFDQFTASFSNESPKEALLAGLSEKHRNDYLLEILDNVRDFEAEQSVIFQKLFVDWKTNWELCLITLTFHSVHDNRMFAR